MKRRTLVITVAMSVLFTGGAMAEEAPLKILSTIAVQGALTNIEPMVFKGAGVPVKIEYTTTNAIVERVTKGEFADMVILTQAAAQQLAAAGKVKSQTDLVRSEVGIGLADNAPKPPMKTTEDLIAFLKATPSIAYTSNGASGVHMAQTIEKLGLSELMKPKTTVLKEGFAAELVRAGKVAAAVQQVSELKFGGAKNIVPLPDANQSRLVFSTAVLNGTQHADGAAKIVKVLTSAEAAKAYNNSGVMPVFK